MRNIALLVLSTSVLWACSAITLVDMQTQTIANSYTVNPQRSWSRLRDSNAELWTVDGFALQALRFPDPIEDGGRLFTSNSQQKMPAFRKAMMASEVQEFVVDSLVRAGAQDAKASGLRPVRFGSLDGFRFDLAMLSANGLEMSGVVNGAVGDGKLYLIIYTGTRSHYFARYQPQVERLFESIQLKI